jgi:VanZ like protein
MRPRRPSHSPVTEDLLLHLFSRRSLPRLAVAMAVATILAATLPPSGDEKLEPMLRCLVCGQRGVADVILNVMLFAPLGFALRLNGERLLRVCIGTALLSGAIELAQLFIPGRDTSLSDVLTNVAGAATGYALARYAPRAVALRGSAAALLSAGAAALPVLTVAATGMLLRPAFPRSTYYGLWTPNLGHLEWYRGRVRSVELGALALPPLLLAHPDTVRTLLLEGVLLQVQATAGPPVPGLAPLFSIVDDGYREILLLGLDKDDLVFRYRARATAWRLDQPDLRVPDVLKSIRVNDSLAIVLWREPDGYCIALNGARTCRLRFTAGRGWAVLHYFENFAPWTKRLLDIAWLAGLLVPVGVCARTWRAAWSGGALLASAGLLPPLVGLAATPLDQWVGAVAGIAAGAALRTLAVRRHERRPDWERPSDG